MTLLTPRGCGHLQHMLRIIAVLESICVDVRYVGLCERLAATARERAEQDSHYSASGAAGVSAAAGISRNVVDSHAATQYGQTLVADSESACPS